MQKQYYVYILSNRYNTVFYIGVTSNLEKRIYEHKNGVSEDSFTKKYNAVKLVYFENHRDVKTAIAREKRIKKWRRKWKIELVKKENPKFEDLYYKYRQEVKANKNS